MPYPSMNPIAKHDLVLPEAMMKHLDGSLINSQWMFSSTGKIFEALKVAPAEQHVLKALSNVYSYGDAPTVPGPLSRALFVVGVADTALSIVRKLLPDGEPVDCLHKCTLGVKLADEKHVAQLQLTPHDVRNSRRFANFLRQLRRDGTLAIVSPDKMQRFGIIRPLHVSADNGDSPYHADEFAADIFIGKVEEVKSFLATTATCEGDNGPDHTMCMDQNDESSVAGFSEPTSTEETSSTGLWQPPLTESSNDAGFGNDSAGFDAWVPPPTNGLPAIGNKRKRSDELTETNNFHSNSGAAAADKFYSNLTRSLDTRANSRLFHMRAFNGWVKATQIQELDPTARRGKLRVLDLACGKGGDLGKWALHSRGIENYVGIDVARGSLKDAALRARKMRRKLRQCTFTCADLGSDVPGRLRSPRHKHMQQLLTWSFQNETEYEVGEPKFAMVPGGGIKESDKFDVVSIQFAIHYMMSSRKRARRFFQTVNELLEVGGNLIATTIDARVAVQGLMDLGLDLHFDQSEPDDTSGHQREAVVSVGGGACRILFERETMRKLFASKNGDCKDDDAAFGLQYTFTLVEGWDHGAGVGDAVNLPEWLTPIPTLKSLAAEAGLELVSVENFHEFFANRRDPDSYTNYAAAHTALYNMKVLNQNGSLSCEEWDISRLYAAIKFRKVRESTMTIEDNHESSKLLPMAMMKAKNRVGKAEWETLTGDEKKRLIQVQLDALSTN